MIEDRFPPYSPYPSIQGSWAPLTRAHPHRMREISRSTEGELILLTSCADCGKTEVIKPNKRMRKVRDGFTDEQWRELVELAIQRLDEAGN